MTKTSDLVEDSVLYIPRAIIHPDPDQPRVKVDAELQASIDSEGIIQAITVRPHPAIEDEWMIVDGERRWVGGAHLKTIPCRIRLDLEDPVDRLITQLTANTGKPLSPIEQAKAFKLLMDDEDGLSQAELAKRLGIARSTIGDRIRLVEIHPAWMKLIESGRLQVSHAPLIHQYRAVPDDYQVKAAKNISDGEGWQIKKYEKTDVIPVSAMRAILHEAYKDYVVRMADVPSYKGPVLMIEEQSWHGAPFKKVRYAADIKLWRPIKNAAEKRRKKERESSGRSSGYSTWLSAPQKAVKALKAAGFDPPLRAVGDRRVLPEKGEAVIHNENGWPRDVHPKVLLAKIDPSKITYVKGNYGGDELFTSDTEAVEAAREAYRQHVANIAEKELASLRKLLTPELLAEFAVAGPGTIDLVSFLNPDRGTPKVVALALGLTIAGGVSDGDSFDDDEDAIVPSDERDAARLLSALAAVRAEGIEVPDDWQIGQLIRKGVADVPFKLPERPKSKKQQKREAHAAGKQVGDPSRAHDDNLHGLLDEKSVEEEELVEA